MLTKYIQTILSLKNHANQSIRYPFNIQYRLQNLITSVPFLIAMSCFLITISQSPVLVFGLFIGGIAVTFIQKLGQQTKIPSHCLVLLQTLVLAAILSVFWLDWFADPAAAQFFSKAENFFKTSLTDTSQSGASSAVSLVFNVIRALYLLYVAVALIGVVNAVRKDEDWQVVARTPLLVVIAVTIADVLTSFITG